MNGHEGRPARKPSSSSAYLAGTRIASAGRDLAICLWDVATGEEVARLAERGFALKGHRLVTKNGKPVDEVAVVQDEVHRGTR